MWPFKKIAKIKDIARDDDPDEASISEELPSFAPEIIMDMPPKSVNPDPLSVEHEEKSMLPEIDREQEETLLVPPTENKAEQEESHSEEKFSETPAEIFARLKVAPLSVRTYALYEGRIFLCHPDGADTLYLFSEYGDYNIVAPESCKAFIRISLLGGTFRNKCYTSSDFEYIIKEHAFPLCVLARGKAQYDNALKNGYKPYKTSHDGKGMLLFKAISLYRMKDLCLRVHLALTAPVAEGESFIIELPRTVLEEVDCEKQFRILCKKILDMVLGCKTNPFFTVQVLKIRRNIAVCLPLEGIPAPKDHFGGGTINATAPSDDGTLLIQIGQDEAFRPNLAEGFAERGQHRLSL